MAHTGPKVRYAEEAAPWFCVLGSSLVHGTDWVFLADTGRCNERGPPAPLGSQHELYSLGLQIRDRAVFY